jgi:transposase
LAIFFIASMRERMVCHRGTRHLRQRTTLEHSLARVGHIQGTKARYTGTRKNTLDVRRAAIITNLQRLARLQPAA